MAGRYVGGKLYVQYVSYLQYKRQAWAVGLDRRQPFCARGKRVVVMFPFPGSDPGEGEGRWEVGAGWV